MKIRRIVKISRMNSGGVSDNKDGRKREQRVQRKMKNLVMSSVSYFVVYDSVHPSVARVWSGHESPITQVCCLKVRFFIFANTTGEVKKSVKMTDFSPFISIFNT